MTTKRDMDSLLAYEASRRPNLANLMNNLEHITKEDVEAANLPLKWMREAVCAKIAQAKYKANLVSVEARMLFTDGNTPDPVGDVLEWRGANTPISFGMSSMKMEIEPGDLLWYVQDKGVWYQGQFSRVVDPKIFANAAVLCKATKRDYNQMTFNKLDKGAKFGTSQPSHDTSQSVRFFKPIADGNSW